LTSQVDNVIDALKDGQWHTMIEISQKTKLHELKIVILAEFLAAYTFLHLDKEERRARLSEGFTVFLQDTEKDEGNAPHMPKGYTDIKASKLR
jgi:hypothetical protein